MLQVTLVWYISMVIKAFILILEDRITNGLYLKIRAI